MAYHVRIVQTPQTAEELAQVLQRAALHGRTIAITGNGSKQRMGGPARPADEHVSLAGLNRLLQYEPSDLTVSVEAGMPWRQFTAMLEANRQMVALDPPWEADATVGGVVAANTSGPRRLLYGTARDVVIGVRFATLEGKLVDSGGMVVKNVAGLDMAKLMIGSFGTLAALTIVNFKVSPLPETERSFLFPFATPAESLEARDRVLASPLRPSALDLLNPEAAAPIGKRAWLLALRAGGNPEAMDRCERELTAMFAEGVAFDDSGQLTLWRHVREFTPQFLARHPDGAVVRASCTLKGLEEVIASFNGPAVARAGTGVCYGYFERAGEASGWLREAAARGWKAAVECAPDPWRETAELWPSPGSDFEVMRRIKRLFDPGNVLNRGRLYGRI